MNKYRVIVLFPGDNDGSTVRAYEDIIEAKFYQTDKAGCIDFIGENGVTIATFPARLTIIILQP